MIARISALIFIFAMTAIAWAVLGATIFSRTYGSSPALKEKVESSWGSPHSQRVQWSDLQLEGSALDVGLELEHRQKGLLWYSTYRVAFAGSYRFRNVSDREKSTSVTWFFPTEKAIYDHLAVTLNEQPVRFETSKESITVPLVAQPGGLGTIKVSYRSQGLDNWQYVFGANVSQVRDFTLRMTTNFRDIDFPENTLSPVEKHQTKNGWELIWRYKDLVSGYNIAMAMPAKLQPGPLAGEISYFAPVSLFFFFFVMFIVTTLRGLDLHPMNYFFLAAAFFAFHLLLAYLADHVSIHIAFLICSLVSIGLVVSYLRLVVGTRFALREAGIAQFVYLILFSYAFFFKGFTGLSVTIGAILTLFVVMQLTARLNWSERFRSGAAVSQT